jgi:hypothetical protein
VARPEARFELLRPDAYGALLSVVQADAYRRSRREGRLLDPVETANAWYEDEYLPAVAAIHEVGLPERYPYKTDADLFLWVEGRRRSLEPLQRSVTWLDAAQAAAGEWHGPLTRRRYTTQKRRPLPRRPEPGRSRAHRDGDQPSEPTMIAGSDEGTERGSGADTRI